MLRNLSLFIIGLFLMSACSYQNKSRDIEAKEKKSENHTSNKTSFNSQSPVPSSAETINTRIDKSQIDENSSNSVATSYTHIAETPPDSSGEVCDIVYYKSGKMEYCKIIETSPTEVLYKMCDYLDGPTIRVNKSELHKIHYANGREDIVSYNQQYQQGPNQSYQKNKYIQRRVDGVSLMAFLLSLVALFLTRSILAGFVLSIIGILLAIIGLRRISRSKGGLKGKGFAITAIIICGLLFTILGLYLGII